MRQIILTQQQYKLIMDYRNQFKSLLESRNIDVQPVKLISGSYIIPEKILNDPAYVDIIPQIKEFGNIEIREIKDNEIDKSTWKE